MTTVQIPFAEAVVLAGLCGLLIGSFLNVVIYRVPRGLPVAMARSFCPSCQRQLTWWENVPVVSWVMVRGRCRTCRSTISIRYPVVELATSITFVLITVAAPALGSVPSLCLLSATALSILAIELDGFRTPVSLSALGTSAGLIALVVAGAITGRWAPAVFAAVGTGVGVVVLGVLRSLDPDCGDPRWQGRSILPVAGCWLGSLGGRAAVVGGVSWLVMAALCLLVLSFWPTGRVSASGAADQRGTDPSEHPWPLVSAVVRLPLLMGALAAMTVSLAACH